MKTRLADLDFDNLTMAEAVAEITALGRRRDTPRIVCTANVDHLSMLQHDAEFRQVYDSADIITADGMPLVLAVQIGGPAR